ncbi:MAG: hypothetical protein ACK5MU_02995 [Candidatus Saccharimonadales bacterium]
MFNLVSWWYGAGFMARLRGLGQRLGRTADTFSIGLMLKTLFNPFRQIDAGAEGSGPSGMMQAFLSRLISRFVGFVMRFFLIIFGTIVLILQSALSLCVAVLHLVIPLLPIGGIIMMIIGWVPELGLW